MGYFTGDPEQNYQQSTLGKEQQPLYKQLLAAGQGQGAGGAFGGAADYYRDLLSNDSQTYNQMQAPQMRQFNEEIIPGLSEQFAGMGSGGLSSSGFRNAAVNAGTDLSERLGAMRAQLRQQGAAGLQSIGQAGLGNYNENIHRPATEGMLGSNFGQALGIAGSMFAGQAGGELGRGIGKAATSWMSGKGSSSPYGTQGNPFDKQGNMMNGPLQQV